MLQAPQKVRFGDQVPPAIFPSIFGLLGLGLAWRRATDAFQAPSAFPDLILGAVTLLFIFATFAYLLKISRRPKVVVEDLRILPGRAGLAAMVLSVYLLAAVLVPMNPAIARGVLGAGLFAHIVLVILVLHSLITGPAEQRQVTPIWHLHFVGFIIAPLSAIPLGYQAACEVVLYVTGAIAVAIWCVSAVQIIRRDPPPPLRPLLAIHLAPASLLGTVSLMLGHIPAALVFAGWGALVLAALLLRARYLTAAGFSPLWGAFTFPLAAYASLLLLLAAAVQSQGLRVAGGIALLAGTLIIPVIAVKVMQAWAKGGLGAKTNAARV
ncbi:tellurium resistance protein [Actibacterium lipolyticum]|uniref:Potassium-tellurite ethidium and proflavin transporter n=1 Tax=Actibacterium lipolyticum TaxID=1524263 RepID=A0A238JY66_9RHOB|nr:tellurium resistance protein [Actibacterium lipolyticum]SMX34782.1 potassium-tellurite ethidium and proflavin transporter [Actibacterium lipolyticum]